MDTPISKVAEEYDVSISTCSLWYNKLRFYASIIYNVLNDVKIGGENVFIEIDECLVVKNKYYKGRKLANQHWIFGGIQRNNGDCFIEFVDRRDRATLLNVIKRRVWYY